MADKRLSVEEVADKLGVAYSTASRYVRFLVRLGYVLPKQENSRTIMLEEYDVEALRWFLHLKTRRRMTNEEAGREVVKKYENRSIASKPVGSAEQNLTSKTKENTIRHYTAWEMIEHLKPGQRAYAVDDRERKQPYWREREGIKYVNRKGQVTFAVLLNVFLQTKYIITSVEPIKTTFDEAWKIAEEGGKVRPVGRNSFYTLEELNKLFLSPQEVRGVWEALRE